MQAVRDELRIEWAPGETVGAVHDAPEDALATLALAHGAGAGMHHPFMTALTDRLVAAGVAVLRYQFAYMDAGSRRPDRPEKLTAVVAAAVEQARELAGGAPIFVGGKSMGGRMSSQWCAAAGAPGVAGLVFVGFPLHPAGREGTSRADHLALVDVPMLFLQGTRDKLCSLDLLRPITAGMPLATVHIVEGADHGFHVLKRSGRTDEEVLEELASTTRAWIGERL